MRIKELKRTVNVSWSPAEQYPVLLAAGSAAQQVDASFNSNSYLELYSLNLEDSGLDLELKSSLQTQHKFQKIVWCGSGVVAGGCDGGLLEFYSASKLMSNSEDALLGSCIKHSGNVSALDINPFLKNLLASGASDSEIFIWDLNNTNQPMAPGNRSQPLDHVQGLAWNQQVQHILGSTFATRCVVWDLRKNEPIMKLSDSQSRTRWRSLAWHPSVATQLCIASEDDMVPVIQLWDLRLAASPLATLEGHHKGVMAVSWCKQDPDLLLSAGKDGRVLCWNPNNTQPGGSCLAELSQEQQWVFDVSWSERQPGMFATSSFDQLCAVHSLLAGSKPQAVSHNHSNILESFGAESFSHLPEVSRAAPAHSAAPAGAALLPHAPRWLRTPTRARFAFGGKLVTFEKCPKEEGGQTLVHISQVVSEPEIVERASELDMVLGSSLSQDPSAVERLAEYCRQKGDASSDQHERYTWFFLRANFLPTFRTEVLNLLGFKQDEIPSRFKGVSAVTGDAQLLANDLAALSRGESTETDAELSTDTSTDLSDAHTLIERKLASVDLGGPTPNNVVIPNGEDSASLICRALVCGNLEEAVELCLTAKRIADALIIASLGSQELLYKVQKYHLNQSAQDPVSLVAGSLLLSKWDSLVTSAAPKCWRETLAAIVTHCEGEALAHYAEMLGDKLSSESDPSLCDASVICYLCAMSAEAAVSVWARATRAPGAGTGSTGGAPRDLSALLALVERALLARRAAQARGTHVQNSNKLDGVITEYASRLAAQGCLQTALNSLEGVCQSELRDRLQHALGMYQQRRPSHMAPAQQTAGPHSRARTVSGHAHKQRHVVAHNDVTNTYSAVQPPFASMGYGVPPAPAPAPATMGAPHVAPPVAPAQPSRPSSVGPQSGGITSRSKYKVDPSVQAAPLYNQYSFNQTPLPQLGQQPQPQGYGAYSTALPEQLSAASVPAPAPVQHNNVGQFAPIQPHPAVNGGYYNPAPVAEPAVPAAPAALEPPAKPVAPGWNDPPMLTSRPKPKQEVQAQAPITHPLFGVEAPQHVPLAGQYPGQQYDQQYPGQQQYQGQQQQYPGQQQQQYPGQQQQQYPGQQQQQYPGQQPQQFPGLQQQYPGQQQQYPGQQQQYLPGYPQKAESPAPVEVAPVQKAPIPEEHLVLQTVFDALRAECVSTANNPQMKRKLEDVQRRLDTMYDLLREYRLSECALATLHTCTQHAQRGEYGAAMQAATSLATTPDFAAVAAFLPGLKTLFQLASQLQVTLR